VFAIFRLPAPLPNPLPTCHRSGPHLHQHVLSSHRGRLLLFHGRVFLYRSSWPPADLSVRIVHFAKEVCHLATFQWYAACLCIICSQTQTAVSTRKSCLLMEAGCCPSTAGSLKGDPSASLCTGRCTYGLGAQGHLGLLLFR